MIKHAAITFGATLLAIAALILTSPHGAAPAPAAAAPAASEADICSETIMAELDAIQEGTSREVASPNYRDIIATCEALGTDAAYVHYVGPELPSCVWEDGSGSALPCYWNAAARGNREGTSYIVTTAP